MDYLEYKINKSIFALVKGDITRQQTDAIVNAANNALLPGGGVSGAIHKAAGPMLLEECKKIGGCPTGEAILTKGYNLDAKFVIHTVGPVYSGKPKDEADLANAYRSSLKLAQKNNIKSISFPSVSTGIFGYPVREASRIAISTIIESIKEYDSIEKVQIVLFSTEDFLEYANTAKEILEKRLINPALN